MGEVVVNCRRPTQILPSLLLLIATVLLAAGAYARAEQGADVAGTTKKAKTNPTARPTLLVLCDLACNWKLDGEIQGHINAGGGAKVKVESGQHMVEANTEDGVDQVKLFSTVKPTGQTLVSIELQAIRDQRIEAYNQAVAESNREDQEKAAREQREEDRRERDAQAREQLSMQQAALREPWTDPATGLMWARKDNGSNLSWQEAVDYCKNLRLADCTDWRLPTTSELQGIRTIRGSDLNGPNLKGNIQLSGWAAWSSEQVLWKKRHPTGRAWVLVPSYYSGPGLESIPLDGRDWPGERALCVRGTSRP